MSRFYVACDLRMEIGRVILGTLSKDQLTISEVQRFPNVPLHDRDSLYWDIPQLYERTLEGLRAVGSYEETIESISCTAWGGDYLLFAPDGSLITPTFHHLDKRTETGRKQVLANISWENLYDETGMQRLPSSTLFQLAAESPKRLKHSKHLLPVGDGFNCLFSGVSRVEVSAASTTQLYNPSTNAWSQRLVNLLHLPAGLLAPITAPGTELGALRPEVAKEARLDETKVVTSCSHTISAALFGLPNYEGEDWAFIHPGKSTQLGTTLGAPLIGQASRELGLSNDAAYHGSFCFHKQVVGLSLLDECQRSWKQADREIDAELLSHLAGSAVPFESLIDPTDQRFTTPGDMPQKIQAFCKETGQTVPRRPGPIFRCILESLALLYRKSLQEVELLTGARFGKLFILGRSEHPLLNHFIANALRIPSVIVGEDSAAIGNIALQALTLGHIQTPEQVRALVRTAYKNETIVPYATAWDAAYDRLVALSIS